MSMLHQGLGRTVHKLFKHTPTIHGDQPVTWSKSNRVEHVSCQSLRPRHPRERKLHVSNSYLWRKECVFCDDREAKQSKSRGPSFVELGDAPERRTAGNRKLNNAIQTDSVTAKTTLKD